MKTEKANILEKVGRRDGMTVPAGYFDDFAAKMAASLPANPKAEEPRKLRAPRTMWDRVRPFVYLAAMFAGIWCMLRMFTMMSGTSTDLSIDNHKILTEALSDENFVIDHVMDDINERELLDEIYDDSIDVSEFDTMITDDSELIPEEDGN